MTYLILAVICYTITSLNDKYAVSKAKLSGSQMTFIMSAATAFFMLLILPFSDRTITLSPLTFLFVALIVISKMLEFQMSAKILLEMSAFELKAWLGTVMFISYFTDIFMGKSEFTVLRLLCIVISATGLVMIASSGKKNVNYKKIILPLILYLASRYGYGLVITAVDETKVISSAMTIFFALIVLAIITFPSTHLKELIKGKPKETLYCTLAKIPNAFGLLLENAVISVSLVLQSFIQPMLIVVLFVISVINHEKYGKLSFAGSIVCILGIILFEVCGLF